MSVLDQILHELDERYIVDHVGRAHDEARLGYRLDSNTVNDDTEFDDVIGNYYNYHFTTCVSSGGSLSRTEAVGRAKEVVEREYRRKGRDKLHAYADGKQGYNGGMRAILDMIMEYLKEEAIERHVRDVVDRYVRPTSFDEQVEIVREIVNRTDVGGAYIEKNRPERYARNYEELIRSLVESIKAQASRFRRL